MMDSDFNLRNLLHTAVVIFCPQGTFCNKFISLLTCCLENNLSRACTFILNPNLNWKLITYLNITIRNCCCNKCWMFLSCRRTKAKLISRFKLGRKLGQATSLELNVLYSATCRCIIASDCLHKSTFYKVFLWVLNYASNYTFILCLICTVHCVTCSACAAYNRFNSLGRCCLLRTCALHKSLH